MSLSNFIALLSLVTSVSIAFFVVVYEDFRVKPNRFLHPETQRTIYESHLPDTIKITLDFGHKQMPFWKFRAELLDSNEREAYYENLLKELLSLKSKVCVFNQDCITIDSLYIGCGQNQTISLSVPPKGYITLRCCKGCNSAGCYYDFINWN